MTFDPILNLANLDGNNGFVIDGIDANDGGQVVSEAGDINGDGIDDILIGASGGDPNGNSLAGESYVVFGRPQGFGTSLNLADLNGSNGFVLNGVGPGDRSGNSVSSLGDINGDGFDDLIIGAFNADANGNANAGESYVVFGSSQSFDASLDLAALNGSNGFALSGIAAFDLSGISVSGAGDINGDDIDDLIIGASGANISSAGESYVVFGSSQGFGTNFNLANLNGSNGFTLIGVDPGDQSGRSVSGAGDVNGDGIDDLIVGARSADPNGSLSGESYVVFGRSQGFGSTLDLAALNGNNGFVINGVAADDQSGIAVSGAGDINGDGLADVVISSPLADPSGKSNAGASYVVYGSDQGFNASLELADLDGSNGFVIEGISPGNLLASAVDKAGDINGDGVDDLILGNSSADPNGQGNAGESYVIFGNPLGFGSSLDLTTLNGSNGFVIEGVVPGDVAGGSVSGAGDVNGDGIDDLIVGSSANANGLVNSGRSYVIFGRQSSQAVPLVKGEPATIYVDDSNTIVGNAFQAGETYGGELFSNTDGTANADDVIQGTAGDDDIWAGSEGSDIIDGGAGNDTIGFGSGDACVIAGTGDDFVYGVEAGGGSNIIDLGTGNNQFWAAAGDHTITSAGNGNNQIGIGLGDDDVTTGDGDDFVYSVDGGGGQNSLDLGNGDNSIWVEGGSYDIVTGTGADAIGLGTGNDTVRAGDGDNVIYTVEAATAGDKDILTGSGSDYIQTGAGSDRLDGGLGSLNTLIGGGGVDTFVMRDGTYNYIEDFEIGTDAIELAGLAFAELSFSQGTGDASTDAFISVNDTIVLQAANTDVTALNNVNNFIPA
ncbi:hypothetical protein [Sphaerothrix gracilis]|uniref:beta strand repeat-containing protein n=1 Tax=Sphaerothrix gracilis TaxID=3151835 RepID=UPI0031FD9C3E